MVSNLGLQPKRKLCQRTKYEHVLNIMVLIHETQSSHPANRTDNALSSAYQPWRKTQMGAPLVHQSSLFALMTAHMSWMFWHW